MRDGLLRGFCCAPKAPDEFQTELEGMCTSDSTSERCVADTDCCNPADKCLNATGTAGRSSTLTDAANETAAED